MNETLPENFTKRDFPPGNSYRTEIFHSLTVHYHRVILSNRVLLSFLLIFLLSLFKHISQSFLKFLAVEPMIFCGGNKTAGSFRKLPKREETGPAIFHRAKQNCFSSIFSSNFI